CRRVLPPNKNARSIALRISIFDTVRAGLFCIARFATWQVRDAKAIENRNGEKPVAYDRNQWNVCLRELVRILLAKAECGTGGRRGGVSGTIGQLHAARPASAGARASGSRPLQAQLRRDR